MYTHDILVSDTERMKYVVLIPKRGYNNHYTITKTDYEKLYDIIKSIDYQYPFLSSSPPKSFNDYIKPFITVRFSLWKINNQMVGWSLFVVREVKARLLSDKVATPIRQLLRLRWALLSFLIVV